MSRLMIVVVALGLPQLAAAAGRGPCGMLGMFDTRAKAACEAALAAAGSRSTTSDRVAPSRRSTEEVAVPVPGADLRTGAIDGAGARPASLSPVQPKVPAEAASRPARTARPAIASPVHADDNLYRSTGFDGLSTWRDLFAKAANSPAEFAKIQAQMTRDSTGSQAAANGLVKPGRNYLQKLLTDYELYRLYYGTPAALLVKQNQCLAPRVYTPEEACDCLAGFPGDTAIGPGAGELVISSNHAAGVKACGTAMANATDPALKARYLAQRARAQVRTTDPAQAVAWADEAIKAGYRRATIIKAEANLWDIEFLSGVFPPMTQSQFDQAMKDGTGHLRAARQAGVRETYLVATEYQQTLARLKFNSAVLTPIVKSMMAPPPKGNCGPDSRDSNGKSIAGSGCIGVDMSR